MDLNEHIKQHEILNISENSTPGASTASDVSTTETGVSVQDKLDELDAREGGVSFASGIIKASTSVINATSLTSITDWSGSAGAYTSTITLNSAKAYGYVNNIVFYQLSGSDYIQIVPSEVKVTSTTAIQITMPVNSDLYIGVL